MFWIIVLAALIPVAHYLVSSALKEKQNQVNQEFARLNELFVKRADLMALLLPVIKTHFKDEAVFVTEAAKIRTKAASSFLSEEEKIDLDPKVTAIVENIFNVAQNYPDVLKNAQFMDTKIQLQKIESELKSLRKSYNTAAAQLNTAIKVFPTSIIASMMNLLPKKLFVS